RPLTTVAALSAALVVLAAATTSWAAISGAAEPAGLPVELGITGVSLPGGEQVSVITASPSPSPTALCTRTWSIIPSPNVLKSSNRLLGVSALSTNDVWAVGHYDYSTWNGSLIEHWDGAQWTIVENPQLSRILNDVEAVSASDVWAVGGWNFIERW